MTYKLFIDDIRFPPLEDGFIVVNSSKDAIEYMKKHGCPYFISFDHDLGGDDTTRNVINWMINKDLDEFGFIHRNFKFNTHSQNPIGKIWITGTLESYLNYRK